MCIAANNYIILYNTKKCKVLTINNFWITKNNYKTINICLILSVSALNVYKCLFLIKIELSKYFLVS